MSTETRTRLDVIVGDAVGFGYVHFLGAGAMVVRVIVAVIVGMRVAVIVRVAVLMSAAAATTFMRMAVLMVVPATSTAIV